MNAKDPGNCNRIFDVVRGMVECRDMGSITRVLSNLSSSEAIELVRMKDRFFAVPSPGGWRDCMVCFVVKDDPHKHVCEVQLVHHDLLTARKGLPGTRSTTELAMPASCWNACGRPKPSLMFHGQVWQCLRPALRWEQLAGELIVCVAFGDVVWTSSRF